MILFTCGLPAYGFLPYVLNATFIERARFIFSGVVLAMFTGAIGNTPMLKLVIYPCAFAALMVAHGAFTVSHRATPPNFLLELKKGRNC